jgi:RNA polymerase sigma factor for flagellar operon FliA
LQSASADYHGMATTTEHLSSSEMALCDREQLILEHLPQVKWTAQRISKHIGGSVSMDDLISAGTVGLIAAIDRYDARYEVMLKTYAEHKIRGAILDSLRELDSAPRKQRKRRRQIESAMTTLTQDLQRAPEEKEIAVHLGLTVVEYRKWLAESRGMTLCSLEVAGTDSEGSDLLRFVGDSDENWPSKIVERTQLEELIAQRIGRMPKVEGTVLSLHYYEGLTLREISTVLNLRESRVSQLKTQGILRLRSVVQKQWGPSRSDP